MGTRYLSLMLEDVQLELFNNFWGRETVTYNGEIVSQINSIFGGRHKFDVQEKGENVNYEVRISFRNLRIGFDIYRNNKTLLLS